MYRRSLCAAYIRPYNEEVGLCSSHMNLNIKSWYIRATFSPCIVREGPNSRYKLCTVMFEQYNFKCTSNRRKVQCYPYIQHLFQAVQRRDCDVIMYKIIHLYGILRSYNEEVFICSCTGLSLCTLYFRPYNEDVV